MPIDQRIVDVIRRSLGDEMSTSLVGDLGSHILNEIGRLSADHSDRCVISPEIDAKIRFLKECELNADIAWIDHISWGKIPIAMQKLFIKLVNPLLLADVYFQHSALISHQDVIFSTLPNNLSVFQYRDQSSNRYLFIDNESRKSMDNLIRKDQNLLFVRSISQSYGKPQYHTSGGTYGI